MIYRIPESTADGYTVWSQLQKRSKIGLCPLVSPDQVESVIGVLATGLAQMPETESGDFTAEEVNTMRQWFDSVQDTNGGYLNPDDYVLAAKLYRLCGMRVPNSISSISEQRAQT